MHLQENWVRVMANEKWFRECLSSPKVIKESQTYNFNPITYNNKFIMKFPITIEEVAITADDPILSSTFKVFWFAICYGIMC